MLLDQLQKLDAVSLVIIKVRLNIIFRTCQNNTATLRKLMVMAAKKEQTVNVDSLQLTLQFDRDRLEITRKGDVLGESPGNNVQDIAAKMFKLHAQRSFSKQLKTSSNHPI